MRRSSLKRVPASPSLAEPSGVRRARPGGTHLERDTLLSVIGIVAAGVLLLVAAAGESILTYLSRSRARGLGQEQGEALSRYIQERASLLSTLHLARNVAIIIGVASAVHYTVGRHGTGWLPVLVACLIALAVIGLIEGIPEMLGARNPGHWALVVSPVIRLLGLVFWLPSRLLDLPGLLLARFTPAAPPEEEEGQEILRLVEMEQSKGIEEDERQMIRGVIRLEATTAREIMVPRPDISAVEATLPVEDVQRLMVQSGYSRIPVYEETIDNIVGVIYVKDLLRLLVDGRRPASLVDIARETHFVPETKKLDELLGELRGRKTQIAVVVDEYGGTAGIVTTEDILEEIVGEIEDEHDAEEAPVERINDDEVIVSARLDVDTLNDLFHLDLADEDYDTVGGIVYNRLGKVPVPGDEVRLEGVCLHVLAVSGQRVTKIRATRLAPEPVEG